MPPVVRNFFIFQDNCPLTVIADADLHHIMKMQVINLITVVLYPFFAQKRQHRTFLRHFVVAVFYPGLFLSAHGRPLRLLCFFLNHRQKDQRLFPKAGNRMAAAVLAERRHASLYRIGLVIILIHSLAG